MSSTSPQPSSSPPKPPVRTKLHLHPSTSTPDNLVFEANALVSSGHTRKAIELYTDVLYDKAPGHIIALLNRSMAYIRERRPELAAVDAYRAASDINSLQGSKRQRTRVRELQVKRYLRLENLNIKLRRDWTVGDQRYIPAPPGTWPKIPLASLVMDMDPENCPVWHEVDMDDIWPRLELRAIYRLCGALFDCRGGAAQEALGLIDDIRHTRTLFDAERKCFTALGDGIVSTVLNVTQVYRQHGKPTDDEHVVLMAIDGVERQRTKPETMLKTRVALVPALQYWADTYEPDLSKPDTHQELKDLVAASSDSCAPFAVDQSSAVLSPKIELRASKDLLPGDPILYERGPWNVTTDPPENALDGWSKTKAGCLRFYCDTCATALLMPEELVAYVLADVSLEPTSGDRAKRILESIAEGGKTIVEGRERRIVWTLSTHITFCDPDHEAMYCCTTCRRKRRVFDLGVHESRIESELRDGKTLTAALPLEHVSHCHPRSLYAHSKTQTLYDLLFLRVYASALNHNQHPLDLVKFLRGGLSPASAHSPDEASSNMLSLTPWSFQNNVVRPVWMINRYHQALMQDPSRYLKQSDGWVINTLLAKIQHSAALSAGAMSAIVYNLDDESKSYCYRGLEPWVSEEYNTVYDSEEAFNEVWVARLDPLVSMIRVADEAKGERPNCWLKYEEGVKVIAGQPDDPSNKKSAAIKEGEVLLRAKPKFLGGSPYDVVPYSQRDPSTKRVRSESPVKRDHGADHETNQVVDEENHGVDDDMPDTEVQSVDLEAAKQPIILDLSDSGSESSNSSDEEMLDILDRESPEGLKPDDEPRPQSPPSSPVDTDSVANLDGQAEPPGKHLEASATPTASVEVDEVDDEEAWEEDAIRKRRLTVKKRRISSTVPRDDNLLAQYRAQEIRMERLPVHRPPRNTLEIRMVKGDIRWSAPTSPQPKAKTPVALHEDSFGDLPVGRIRTTSSTDDVVDMVEEQRKASAAAQAQIVLRSKSMNDLRKGAQKSEHDPWEGPSGSGKGKAVMRGGDAFYTVRDDTADEDLFGREA
ncbi:MAG: hypothetical protein L6R39_006340 [Caloplaca ligustica]|nr:MAG: hypothetical protein L6R39_006340 [Caloplaca ligustica]